MTRIITPESESQPIRKIPFIDSTPLLSNMEALRARAEEDGFLFFKGFLPKEDVLSMRADFLEVVGRHGWREADQGRLGGGIDLEAINRVPNEAMRDDIGVSIAAYDDVQKMESFHRMPHHPKLLAFYREFLGGEVLPHPRHIARMVTGHNMLVPTPPHQDFPLIQGTSKTWTCWFPLGDCPRTLGGLTMLRGSHRNGYLPIQPAKGAGGMAALLCPNESEWAEGDYEAGDIITFISHTVHKAIRCQHKDQIRLSMDVRYQLLSDPIEEKSLKPHCELTWEQVYADWKSDDLKYYWQRQTPELIPWEDGYTQPGRRIC